ncbi:MAG: hypothetical protein WCD69_09230 [Xanthobacteraceae bacterium]
MLIAVRSARPAHAPAPRPPSSPGSLEAPRHPYTQAHDQNGAVVAGTHTTAATADVATTFAPKSSDRTGK